MRESTACPSITSGKSSKATKEAFSAKLVGRLPCTFVIKDLGPEYEGSAVVHVLRSSVKGVSFFFHCTNSEGVEDGLDTTTAGKCAKRSGLRT